MNPSTVLAILGVLCLGMQAVSVADAQTPVQSSAEDEATIRKIVLGGSIR